MPQMELARVIENPRYSVRGLSDAIMNVPNEYDLLARMGLFPERGIRTTFVEIERKDGVLNILPQGLRGGPATKARSTSRDKVIVKTGYIPHENRVMADDLQNLPAFGTEDFFEQFDEVVMEKMEETAAKFRQTFEYYRWGALRGNVYDADGASVLYNSYDLMGETQSSFDFKFGTTTADGPLAAAKAMRRHLEKSLRGETMTGMLVLASAEFMDKLTTHPHMAKTYENQQGRPNPLLDDLWDGFVHGGVMYVEHNGVASYVDPETGAETEHRFIPEGEAIAVPLGTRQTFKSYFAPGTAIDTVNMPGQAMYVSPKLLDHNRGIELAYESAPLFLVQKPRLVLRGYSSN